MCIKKLLTSNFIVSKRVCVFLCLNFGNVCFVQWSTTVCGSCSAIVIAVRPGRFLLPEQHDVSLFFSWTGRFKFIAPPPSVKSLLRSNFFHSRTANMNAAETLSDVFADVSIKLTTWNSWHHVSTSSGVISRSLAGTSFCGYLLKKRQEKTQNINHLLLVHWKNWYFSLESLMHAFFTSKIWIKISAHLA